jgi:hypothetical protein
MDAEPYSPLHCSTDFPESMGSFWYTLEKSREAASAQRTSFDAGLALCFLAVSAKRLFVHWDDRAALRGRGYRVGAGLSLKTDAQLCAWQELSSL